VSPLVPGWVQRTMLGKDLSGEHLIASCGFTNRTTAFVELDRSGGGAIVVLVLLHILIHRVMLAGWYDALARFVLPGDDGRIGRQDEGRRRLFGPFDLGGQALGGAALGADALLVLLPEPGDEY
jgi:hypothetical protein